MTPQEMVMQITRCNEAEATLHLELAKSDILRETNRTTLPDNLISAQVDIACIRINRLGSEGETSRSQGEISASFESLPDYIKKLVRENRLARVGGYAFETK